MFIAKKRTTDYLNDASEDFFENIKTLKNVFLLIFIRKQKNMIKNFIMYLESWSKIRNSYD